MKLLNLCIIAMCAPLLGSDQSSDKSRGSSFVSVRIDPQYVSNISHITRYHSPEPPEPRYCNNPQCKCAMPTNYLMRMVFLKSLEIDPTWDHTTHPCSPKKSCSLKQASH